MSNHQPAVNAIHGAVKTDHVLTVSYMGKPGRRPKKRKYYLRDICRLLGSMEAAGLDIDLIREMVAHEKPLVLPWVPIDHLYAAEYCGKTPHPDEERDEPIKGCCDD